MTHTVPNQKYQSTDFYIRVKPFRRKYCGQASPAASKGTYAYNRTSEMLRGALRKRASANRYNEDHLQTGTEPSHRWFGGGNARGLGSSHTYGYHPSSGILVGTCLLCAPTQNLGSKRPLRSNRTGKVRWKLAAFADLVVTPIVSGAGICSVKAGAHGKGEWRSVDRLCDVPL